MGAFSRAGQAISGLVGLTGIVSHGLTGVEDAAAVDDVDAPPGSGDEVLSTRGCFTALSSSGRRSDLSCASGLSDVPVASSTVSVLAFGAADLGGGSRDCTGW